MKLNFERVSIQSTLRGAALGVALAALIIAIDYMFWP